MKAILYTLVRSFELELAVKEEDVLRTSAYVICIPSVVLY